MTWGPGGGAFVADDSSEHWCGWCSSGAWESPGDTLQHRPGCTRPADDDQAASEDLKA